MRRKLLALAAGVAVIATVGVGWAALQSKLPGRGTSTKFGTVATWDTTTAPQTNDSATMLDPTGNPDPAGVYTSTARAAYDVGQSTLSYVSGELVGVTTNSYDSYSYGLKAIAHALPGFVIQSINVVDTADPGFDRFTSSDLQGYLRPTNCGAPLTEGFDVQAQIRFLHGGHYSFRMDTILVPAAAYVASSCLDWSAP